MAVEKDTVRIKSDEDSPSPEAKAFDIRKYIVGAQGGSRHDDDDDDLPPKARKQKQKQEQLEDRAHQSELDAQAVEFAPIILAIGSQATDRLTPELPYKYDEALALSKAVVNFSDKYSDSFLGDWKEEIALVMVGASQIIPRVMMWRAKQPKDLSTMQSSVPDPSKMDSARTA